MTTRRLLLDSIRHYWRTHLGVILGSALAALVLTGALMVGDSVKATLRAQAGARVGKIGEALLCGERFVPWPHEVEKRPSVVARTFFLGFKGDAAGVLMLTGTAARSDGKARANKVQIVGVDDAFWKLSPGAPSGAASGALASSPATLTPREAPISPRPAAQKNAASPTANVAGGDASAPSPRAPLDGLAINERLAAQLGVQPGDEVLLRFEKPSAFSKDAPLSGEEEGSLALRVRVARVVGDADFGRFALASGQVPPHTAFVPLAMLQEKIGVNQKVNLILKWAGRERPNGQRSNGLTRSWWVSFRDFLKDPLGRKQAEEDRLNAEDAARLEEWFIFEENMNVSRHLPDWDITVRDLPNGAGFELRSPRVFLENAIVAGARENEKATTAPFKESSPGSIFETPLPTRGLDSLTYFVNELRAGDSSDAKAAATPYSMVTAIDAAGSGFVNPKLADGEIQITRWLADDLGVAPGAKVTVKYFVIGERRQLVEKPRTFTVAAPILEMTESQLNGSWMPDFPGLADKANCRDWKPGFDFDATRMRDKDQDYWTKFRGTPKAFVTLKTGQELWGNRWGNLTSIRYPVGTKREQVERIAAFIDPAALGFRIVNLREQALAATNAPVDFGELFVYFSFFLIAAAAVLTGLLFTFTIEQRAAEAGLLLAVGWPVKKVRRLFLREGFVLALIGSLAGALLAALYTKGVLHALAGVWGGATGGTRFVFAPSAVTMAIGVVSGVFVALIAMWLASRRLFKMEAAVLLNGETAMNGSGTAVPPVPIASLRTAEAVNPTTTGEVPVPLRSRALPGAATENSRRWGQPFPLAFVLAIEWAGVLVILLFAAVLPVFSRTSSAILFFALGFLLLGVGIFCMKRCLNRIARGTGADSLGALAARNTARRRGRSLAVVAVLASGVFMVIAVDSFRKGAPEDSVRRDSGTGGFAFIGESSAPIYEDLNSAKGREAYALDDKLMSGVRIVQMRVRDGDDASCLNLNRAVQPRLLGVDFSELRDKPFALDWPGVKADAAVPGVVDANTLQWAMQKKLGDVLEYAGERGEPVRVKFSATVSGSVLQGLVIIPERDFTAKFPNTAGYRFFLVDCPREKMDAVREHLTRQLGDRGLELIPALKRLAEFNEVENTYLSIFQVLGGLGMLLGSAGLGIVVARNVFERRREFGLLEAVGFTPRTLRRLVFAEHRWLIIGALGIGAVSALTAVWPRLSAQAAHFPWRGILTLLAGMALLGAFWAWVATRFALRRSQLPALRTE
jgi:putative ABC transport system permease protein